MPFNIFQYLIDINFAAGTNNIICCYTNIVQIFSAGQPELLLMCKGPLLFSWGPEAGSWFFRGALEKGGDYNPAPPHPSSHTKNCEQISSNSALFWTRLPPRGTDSFRHPPPPPPPAQPHSIMYILKAVIEANIWWLYLVARRNCLLENKQIIIIW